MEMRLFLLFLWLIVVIPKAQSDIKKCSKPYNNVDFVGNDITFKSGPPESCCQHCRETCGCVGYSWIDYGKGGECWLKSKIEENIAKKGIISGILDGQTNNVYNRYYPPGQDNIEPWKIDETFLEILPQNGCQNDTKLLIGILSRPSEFELRQWIRSNWGNPEKVPIEDSTRLIFIIANSGNKTTDQEVLGEIRTHGDILKLDHQENYWNLTLKVYGLLRYSETYCKDVKCVQKTDSDAIVNVPGVELLCDSQSNTDPMITGMIWKNIPYSRDPQSRHYVPWYVVQSRYAPDAATGLAYLMSGRGIASKMLKALEEQTPFFRSENYRLTMEDVMFAGDVRKAAKIPHQNIGGYFCCGQEMKYWCDESTEYVQIPIAFETKLSNKDESWALMQNMIGNQTCEPTPDRFNSRLPVILTKTKFFGLDFEVAKRGRIPSCPRQCVYTNDLSKEKFAQVNVYHARDMTTDNLSDHQIPYVVNVFFNMESPQNTYTNLEAVPKHFFDLTMTYRTDSNVYCPYDQLNRISDRSNSEDKLSEKEEDEMLSRKTLPVLYFVSNCKTPSKREEYVEKLKEFINITQFGRCNNKTCDDKCEQEQIEQHYFYLAFENSACKDYVTEKFWRMKKHIVPIVLNRNITEEIIPGKYFIAADDFKSPSELANHLNYLIKNPIEYRKYLGWHHVYEKSKNKGDHFEFESCFCRLCEKVWEMEFVPIESIKSWWNRDCIVDYGRELLNNDL